MFSPIKIILLLLVIGGVYLIARKAGFLGHNSGENTESIKKKGPAATQTTDLVRCPLCGTYVTSLEDHICES